MNRLYVVCTYEIHRQDVLITADSPEQAIEKVVDGYGQDDGITEYVERVDFDEWSAKPANVTPDTPSPREVPDAG